MTGKTVAAGGLVQGNVAQAKGCGQGDRIKSQDGPVRNLRRHALPLDPDADRVAG